MADNESYLLALPMEMLQRISSFATSAALLEIRLTCKTISAAAFDEFAKEYLNELHCYVMDTTRMKRLQNITAIQRFPRKVRILTFTTNPLEGKNSSDFHIVLLQPGIQPPFPLTGGDYSLFPQVYLAQLVEYENYEDEQIATHCTELPDLSPLPQILLTLNADRVKLCIDLNFYKYTINTGRFHPHVSNEILNSVAEVGVPYFALKVSQRSIRCLEQLLLGENTLIEAA